MDDQQGLSDADWAELDAATTITRDAPEPEAAPSETAEPLSLQETQTPDTTEQSEQIAEAAVSDDAPGDDEAVPEEVHAKIVELERALSERDAAEAAKQSKLQDELQAYQREQDRQLAQEDDEAARGLYNELRNDYGDDIANRYWERRGTLAHRMQKAEAESGGSYSALEALTLAAEFHAPDLMQQIVTDATELAQLPTFDQKQRLLQARRQASQSENAEVQQLRSELQEMRIRMEAMSRPIQADVVEGGRTGSGGESFESQWDNAADFNEAMDLLERVGA